MSKTVQNLLNLLSTIGILLWGFGVFLGVHFASTCSWAVSIPAAVVVTLMMYLLLYMARRYAVPAVSGDFSAAGEARKKLFFALYCLVALFSAWYVMHGVTATTTLKNEVRPRAEAQLQALRDMTSPVSGAGATKGSYQEYVENETANFRNYNPDRLTDASQLEAQVNDLHDLLLTKNDYKLLSKEIRDYGPYAQQSIEAWDWLSVARYATELARCKAEWDRKLIACSQTAAVPPYAAVHTDYVPIAGATDSGAEHLNNTGLTSFSVAGILVVFFLQLIIILSFLAVCRARTKPPVGLSRDENVTVWRG